MIVCRIADLPSAVMVVALVPPPLARADILLSGGMLGSVDRYATIQNGILLDLARDHF